MNTTPNAMKNAERKRTAFKRVITDIAMLAEWIDLDIADEDESRADPGRLETLQKVRGNLIDSLALFSNADREGIEKTLARLHR